MRLIPSRPVLTIVILALPAGAYAASGSLPHQAGAAAVVLWLAALGWGFHAMLHHRLAAEDRLARLETDVVCERDARTAQVQCTQQRLIALDAEWRRLDAAVRAGDLPDVRNSMRAMHALIALLQQPTENANAGPARLF